MTISERMDAINETLDAWAGSSYKPNSVRQAEQMIKQFNRRHKIKSNRFDSNMELGELDEINADTIIDAIEDSEIYIEDLEAKFYGTSTSEGAQGKAGIDTFEDYTRFIDNKTRFENKIISSGKISYYEYEVLSKKAKAHEISQKALDERIRYAYLKKGLEGEMLYDWIYSRIK